MPAPTTANIRALYGKDAVIVRKGGYALVHLDKPTPELRRQRSREFKPETFFCADCPLCQMLQTSGVVVFDDRVYEEAEA